MRGLALFPGPPLLLHYFSEESKKEEKRARKPGSLEWGGFLLKGGLG